MMHEESEDIEAQIEQLRANRAKKRAEQGYEEEDFSEDTIDKPAKKDDGVMGVLLFQCIIVVVIAIIYVLLSTFNKPLANEMKDTVIDKSANDFSFKDKVYDTVGDVFTYLNKIEPIELNDIGDKKQADDTVSDSSQESSSQPSSSEIPLEENEIGEKETLKTQENENGAGGKLNPVAENEMPANATFAPVIFTGRITFPIKKDYNITSEFGFREHPSLKVHEFHTGVDIAAPKSTPIMAAANGVVIKSEKGNSLGNYIIIDHSNGFLTVYGHCDKLIAKEGARIREGEIIARVGSTGDSTGNHLHFAMMKDGLYFDPSYVFKDKIDA